MFYLIGRAFQNDLLFTLSLKSETFGRNRISYQIVSVYRMKGFRCQQFHILEGEKQMKKLLTLAIVFSLTLILNNMSFAQETVAPGQTLVVTANEVADAGLTQEVTEGAVVVESGCCAPVPHRPCPLRPFVRRSCTPCAATPCNPCPPCAPQPPICAPVPRKLCGAPVLPPPCHAEQPVGQYADPCGYDNAGYRPSLLRNVFTRLFSRLRGGYDPYYGYGYGCPEFGYGIEAQVPCEH